jgi:hypothetical protein
VASWGEPRVPPVPMDATAVQGGPGDEDGGVRGPWILYTRGDLTLPDKLLREYRNVLLPGVTGKRRTTSGASSNSQWAKDNIAADTRTKYLKQIDKMSPRKQTP